MIKNGISDENLNKLFTHAQINLRDQDMVRNLAYLGANVVTDNASPTSHSRNCRSLIRSNNNSNGFPSSLPQGTRKKPYQVPRKNRVTDQTYQMSRWTPALKDILEDTIEDKLDSRHFPFLAGRAQSANLHAPTR